MDHQTIDPAAALAALAGGVIPADGLDGGASEVDAGNVLAGRIPRGMNAELYDRGLQAAARLAAESGLALEQLNPEQAFELLQRLKPVIPGFYKQLRADICALYLSDPAVWQRIGFPGPSSETGGYPDFDQPQSRYQKE